MTPDVLALVRTSLADTPVWEWLEPGTRLRIITHSAALDTPVPEHVQVITVADYDHSAQVELAALRAHRTRLLTHLQIISEWDVLRAARLRERLSLPGQHYASANAFRDKALMKELWHAHGVPAAPHARIEVPSDLTAFADRVGYPVVVKPRRAAGSLGVAVLHTPHQVRSWLAQHWRIRDGDFSPWLAEAFIDGQLIQVDGVYDDGQARIAWPTAIGSLLSWQQDGAAPVHAVMLDPEDATVEAAQALVRRALAALPAPAFTAFHAELWVTDRGLLMNEIGARVGGAGTARMIEASFGANLHRLALRGAVYPGSLADEQLPTRPRASAGFAMVPRRAGRVTRVEPRPADLHRPWLAYCSIRVAAGETSPPAHNSVDAAAHFVAVGQHGRQVAERLTRATDWARRAIVYEPRASLNAA